MLKNVVSINAGEKQQDLTPMNTNYVGFFLSLVVLMSLTSGSCNLLLLLVPQK